MSEHPSSSTGGMHRVISDPDTAMEDTNELESSPSGHPHNVYVDVDASAVGVRNDPAVIAYDDDDDDDDEDEHMEDVEQGNEQVPLRQLAARSISSGSSLSDGSAGLLPDSAFAPSADQQQQHQQHQHQSRMQNNTAVRPSAVVGMTSQQPLSTSSSSSPARKSLRPLHRMDSGSSGSLRARSENSSNDWGYGWYEDVHTSEHQQNNISNNNNNNRDKKLPNSHKKSGMMPQMSSRGEVHDELMHLVPKDSEGRCSYGNFCRRPN